MADEKMNQNGNAEGTNGTENNGANQNEQGEKKGFHPIQAVKDKKAQFEKDHPVATRRLKRAGDIGKGAALGGLAVFLGLAGYGKYKEGQVEQLPDLSGGDDGNDDKPAGLE